MKKAVQITVLAAASLLAMSAIAQGQGPAATATPTMAAIADAMGAREKITAVGVVQTVDLKNRLVSIKNEDGKIFTIHAGPEVRNLAQIGPGSVVKVEYHEALAMALEKSRAAVSTCGKTP
ncbi:MAG: hypothetical protein IPL59_08320 [Candidatus Competibacteraceae bacterium]|nr:hypothetical protein [Candidatus Competibacteraceae bacterium]